MRRVPDGGELSLVRPASKAKIDVNVRDASGQPVRSEVTLWAVDYGVLSLTDYKTPDVLQSIYIDIGFLFSINYAELTGVRVQDGQRVQEKLHE